MSRTRRKKPLQDAIERRWASLSPIALDRSPGELLARDPVTAAPAVRRARKIVALACEGIGLPRPGFYHEILHTDSSFYGGANMGNGGGV